MAYWDLTHTLLFRHTDWRNVWVCMKNLGEGNSEKGTEVQRGNEPNGPDPSYFWRIHTHTDAHTSLPLPSTHVCAPIPTHSKILFIIYLVFSLNLQKIAYTFTLAHARTDTHANKACISRLLSRDSEAE